MNARPSYAWHASVDEGAWAHGAAEAVLEALESTRARLPPGDHLQQDGAEREDVGPSSTHFDPPQPFLPHFNPPRQQLFTTLFKHLSTSYSPSDVYRLEKSFFPAIFRTFC